MSAFLNHDFRGSLINMVFSFRSVLFYINSTHMHGASKLTQTSLVYQLVKCHKSILKYHSRNLFQKKRITFTEFVMNCPSKTEKPGVGRQPFLLKGVYYE